MSLKLSNVYEYYGTIASRDSVEQEMIRQEIAWEIRKQKGLDVDMGSNPRLLEPDEAIGKWHYIIEEVEAHYN